ncbi:MAG TPA: penicillin-binding transpeptidase domain-containing protein [Bacteroidota bacterium]
MRKSKKKQFTEDHPRVEGAKKTLGRLLFVKIGLLAFFALVVVRLVQIQVIHADRYQEIAKKQHEAPIELRAARGNIFDRNGRPLASSSRSVSFGADPSLVGDDAQRIAQRFAKAFGKPASAYLQRLTSSDRRFVYLERKVEPQTARRIHAEELHGLIQIDEAQRLYHYDHLAGQIIGFTGVDDNGLSGIELQLDDQLRGRNGYVIMQRDGLGRTHPSVDYPRIEPTNGNSIQLSIDLEYQSIVEQELQKGIERYKAEAGLVIMMDPSSGEILAMANYPFMVPANAATTEPGAMRNRTITDMFEPGSMFKVVTAAAAIEKDIIALDRKFNGENGVYIIPVAGSKPRTIKDTHKLGMITLEEAVVMSSNIVMAKISDVIGAERLYTTARDFGFGITTEIDLPGEVRGELKKPTNWSGTTLNSLAYGYEIGVTPLQIAAAYSAIANKGVLMKPTILQKITNDRGEIVSETYPQIIRRVIKKETAELVSKFLVGVVERGTGTLARIPTMTVAGKTGTARKVIDGKYQQGDYLASFAGFFPAENPKAVCVVMLDNPRIGGYTGGTTSAVIFKAIAEKITAISNRFKQSQPLIVGKQTKSVPDIVSLDVDAATSVLEAHGFDVDKTGEGEVVSSQSPTAGTQLLTGKTVTIVTEEGPSPAITEGFVVVPNLSGAAIRRAINRLRARELDVAIEGSGVVVRQSPPPGQQVKKGTRVLIRCAPRTTTVLATR